jgi:hypothetical protein
MELHRPGRTYTVLVSSAGSSGVSPVSGCSGRSLRRDGGRRSRQHAQLRDDPAGRSRRPLTDLQRVLPGVHNGPTAAIFCPCCINPLFISCRIPYYSVTFISPLLIPVGSCERSAVLPLVHSDVPCPRSPYYPDRVTIEADAE